MNPIVRRVLQLLLLLIIQALLLFISASSISWIAGWIYIGLYFAALLAAAIILIPRKKEVVAERSKGSSGGKSWDILLTRIITLPSLGILIIAGLQERMRWTPNLDLVWQVFGGMLFVLGYAVVVWAMYSNPFFSSIVRIQMERGHTTVKAGPYHYIRHPGYLGMITSSLGTVLLLGSLWAFIPFFMYIVLVIVRTSLEDKTLMSELAGYKEYAAQTRFRLAPKLW